MPNGYLTFLDLKKQDGTPGYDLVEENVRLTPELEIIPAEVMPGTGIELTVRTDLPTVGFTNIGEGVTPSKSGYISRFFQFAHLDALVKFPVNMAEGKPAALVSKLMTNEQGGFVESAIRHIGAQTWYGVKNDAKGFVGAIAQMGTTASHVFDVNGTAGARSSVFFASVGRNKFDYWFGSNRTLTFDEWLKQTVKDDNQKDMEAMCSWMHCTPGFRLANRSCLHRIKGITEENTKTLTWDLMHKAKNAMVDDLGQIPTHIFMTGRSREQLRQELISPENPNPPAPKDFEGVPIVISHSISNNETI